jgi:hypothetical protein
MLVQMVSMTYDATAMATGVEICTADGAKRAVIDGKQNGLDNAGHDCCCIASVGMPPAFEDLTPPRPSDGAPAELITTGRLSAQWLAPLSRGPLPLA